eukprot:788481_1
MEKQRHENISRSKSIVPQISCTQKQSAKEDQQDLDEIHDMTLDEVFPAPEDVLCIRNTEADDQHEEDAIPSRYRKSQRIQKKSLTSPPKLSTAKNPRTSFPQSPTCAIQQDTDGTGIRFTAMHVSHNHELNHAVAMSDKSQPLD